ncbi:MAG: insulinase family protein, partial [Oligoflexia bacterium]|nr:insulinase family protein [Oligoflexia bacterium]
AYLYFLPSQTERELVEDILKMFVYPPQADEDGFNAIRSEITSINITSFANLMEMPMIGFMAGLRSIYKNGIMGQKSEIENISLQEFADFMKCYTAPNNLVLSLSNTRKTDTVYGAISDARSCFRDESFYEEKNVEFIPPDKEVRYVFSRNNSYLMRYGFPAYSCSDNDVYVYDLIAAVLRNNGIDAENFCFKDTGYFEIAKGREGLYSIEESDAFERKIEEVLSGMDEATLNDARRVTEREYWRRMSEKESFVFLAGKASAVSGGHGHFFDYLDNIKKVQLSGVREPSGKLSINNAHKIILRMER